MLLRPSTLPASAGRPALPPWFRCPMPRLIGRGARPAVEGSRPPGYRRKHRHLVAIGYRCLLVGRGAVQPHATPTQHGGKAFAVTDRGSPENFTDGCAIDFIAGSSSRLSRAGEETEDGQLLLDFRSSVGDDRLTFAGGFEDVGPWLRFVNSGDDVVAG